MTQEVSEREKLWVILSDLFLDTDIDPFLSQIEDALVAAPFDLSEIDRILLDEVYPVCIPNLYDVAGAWAGFETEWLLRRIRKNLDKGLILNWLFERGRGLRARQLHEMVPEWRALRARVVLRKGQT